MKKVISIIIILAIMQPVFTKIGIMIDFEINRDFISEVLCINRDKPMTICSGRCYLTSQLEKADEKENEQAPPTQRVKAEVLYFQNYFLVKFTAYQGSRDKVIPFYFAQFHSKKFISEIFKPPQIS